MASWPRVNLVPSTKEATTHVTEHVLSSSISSPVFFSIRAPLTIDDSDFESNSEYDNNSTGSGGLIIRDTSSEIESEGFLSGEELESVPEIVEANSSEEENEDARPYVLDPGEESASYVTEEEGRTSEEDEHVISIQPSPFHNVNVTRVMPIAKLSMEEEEEGEEIVNDEEDDEQFGNVSEIGFQALPGIPRLKVSVEGRKEVETLVWENPFSMNTATPRNILVDTETVKTFAVKEYGPDTNETGVNGGSGDMEYSIPTIETIFPDKLNRKVSSGEIQTGHEETFNEGIEFGGGVDVRMDALRLSKINVVCANSTTQKDLEAAENNGVVEQTSMKLGDPDEFQLDTEGICFSYLYKESIDDTHVGKQYHQICDVSNKVHETKTNYFVKALDSTVLQLDIEGMEEDIEFAGKRPIVPQLVASSIVGDDQQCRNKSQAPSCAREYSVDVEVKVYSSTDDTMEHEKSPRIVSSEFSLSLPCQEAVFSQTADLFATVSGKNVEDQLIQISDSLTLAENESCLDDIKEQDANVCLETLIENSKQEGSICYGCTKDLTFSFSEASLDSMDKNIHYSTCSECDILDNDSEQFKKIFGNFHEDMSQHDQETQFLLGTDDVTKSTVCKIEKTAGDETVFAVVVNSVEEESTMTQCLGPRFSWMQQLNLCTEDSNLREMFNRLAVSTGEHSERLGDEKHSDLSLNILVLGKGGVGKSATINSIFGEEKVITNAFEPATASVREIVGMVNDVKIRIIDTPGLRYLSTEQAFNRKILSSVKKYMKKLPVDIVLYVDRLDTSTRDVNDFALVRSITDSLNPSIWQNVIITLTHAAAVPLDGASESPLSYKEYVAQKSHDVRKCIYQAVDDPQQNPLNFMYPVLLVENQQLRGKQVTGELTCFNGLDWRKQLLLLCFYLKWLTGVSSFQFQHHCSDWQSTGLDGCSINFSNLFSRSRSAAHQENSTDQNCNTFQQCSILENNECGMEGMRKNDNAFVWEDVELENKTVAALAPILIPLPLIVFLPTSDETIFRCQNPCLPSYLCPLWTLTDGIQSVSMKVAEVPRVKLNIHLAFPIRRTKPSFGLSVKQKSKLAWTVDAQSQVCYGQGIKMAVKFGRRNKQQGCKATVRVCASDQLQISLVGVLPSTWSVLESVYHRVASAT